LMGQKERHLMQVSSLLGGSLEIVVQPIVVGVKPATLYVEVAPQQLGRFRREAEKLHPFAVTALAERLGLLKTAPRGPVAHRQPHHLGDATSGLKENAHNALFSQVPSDAEPSSLNPHGELRVIDDLGNPGFTHQLEITV